VVGEQVTRELAARLGEDGIDVVRVVFPDLLGTDRGRDVLVEHLPAVIQRGLSFCRAVYSTTPGGKTTETGGVLDAGLPDVIVVPDLDTLLPIPWEPGVAWCIGDAVSPADERPVDESPRQVLRRALEVFETTGLQPVIGPELEYFLCEPDEDRPNGWRPYCDEPGNVYATGRRGDSDGHLLRTLRTLSSAGLQTTGGNHEYAGGQFEINLVHSPAMDAADRAFRFKTSVKELARREGRLATFMAKPFNDGGGSGFHLHLSCHEKDGRNAFQAPGNSSGLSDEARWAIGGILKHAPALAALLNPTVNSYKRFGPDSLAPWLIDWGLDNRSSMLRVPAERGETTRLELRLGDASANPYLGIAGLVAATYLGIRDRIEPPRPSAGYGYDPSKAPTLPATLPDALAYLEEDTAMVEVLGKDFVRSYVDFKWEEVARFQRFVTDWEFTEYAYHL
jgi:glutamine synthetase